MESFYTATGIYLGISVVLLCGMQAIGVRQRRLFTSRFGEGRIPDELADDEADEWQRIHNTKIDGGFWRIVAVGFMFYHLIGFLISVIIARGRPLNPLTIFGASAAIWISILYFIFRPSLTA